ncbi:Transposon Tf2-9 polyprotein [Hypsizygus marmoreus]|uniref:RNA-directed DNA polymerase n=1 Tax=Hypsizygus marmoreus TaxID=39966 RepID=A0A369JEF3_HYPMA|nr:Transposon Tf2-9 polyprotein [Hypsizygus marmoreus]
MSYMQQGAAQRWVRNTVDDIEKGLKTWYLWKEFEAELKDHFESESKKDTAQLAVGTLKQENLTAEEYFDTFESFSHDTHFNDEALVCILKTNLNPRLLSAIYGQDTTPTMYKEWKTAALHKDHQWRELQYNLGYIGVEGAYTKTNPMEMDHSLERMLEQRSEGEVLDGCMEAAVEEHMEEVAVEVYMWEVVDLERTLAVQQQEHFPEPVSQWRSTKHAAAQLEDSNAIIVAEKVISPETALTPPVHPPQRGVKGVPSPSDKCNDMFALPIHEAVSSPVTPNLKKKVTVKIEEVEDEDEKRMREKEKAHGPGILEDATKEPHVPLRNQDQEKPLTGNNLNGAAEHLLKKIREMRKGAIQLLKGWASRGRQQEVTVFLLQSLLTASEEAAIRTLEDLRKPRHYISRMGNHNSIEVSTTLQATDTGKPFQANSLLDSGATGCYIDETFAKSQGLNFQPLSHSIPVYNADNTLNDGGPIRHVVQLRMKILDHVETITLAVTNTGRNDVILGYAWLRRHNPILWEEEEAIMRSVEDDEEEKSVTEDDEEVLEEGERLFILPEDIEHIRAKFTISQQIAEKKAECMKMRKANVSVPDLYVKDFGPVFEKSAFDSLPEKRRWDHAIELKEDSAPFTSKIYPLSRDKQRQLDEFLDEYLKSGRIQPSKSPINRYPLPLVSEIIDKLRGARYFTKFDVRWGYNNVRMREGDEWKAVFITNRGLFEPCIMFFGLTNSSATFQTMMNDLFRDQITRGVVIVYMDDILIFTNSLEEHRRVTTEVLEILCKNNLFLKPEKCEWEKMRVEYLGVIVSENGVEMDPAKVEAVHAWPEPTDKHDLQQFLGFANYYQRFISHFSEIAAPLHRLTGNTPWKWRREERVAFRSLKTAITTAPVLAFPTDHDPYRVEADSSGFATGATLMQRQNNTWLPVAFLSRSLNKVERNYEIHDREMLAIMHALEEWRHHLQGADHPIEIHTDHKNLEYFMTAKKLNRRQARWSLELANYDFVLVHKPGRTMGRADALLRRPDYERGENDNDGVVLIEPHHLRRVTMELEDESVELLKRIRGTKKVEKVVEKWLAAKEKDLEVKDDLILWQNRIYCNGTDSYPGCTQDGRVWHHPPVMPF